MTRAFTAWLDDAVERLSASAEVVGVVAMGSTADVSRADEWSDHDVAIVVRPGSESRFRDSIDWMPDADRVTLRTVEWHGGGKALMDDGRMVEWGVATVSSLARWLADDARVLLDRGGVADAVSAAQSAPHPPNDVDLPRDLATLLFAVRSGVSRLRRGERLSGAEIVRSEAAGALLRAIRAGVASERRATLDRLDGRRRFEVAYPALAAEVARALDSDPETRARQLIAIAAREFGEAVPHSAVATLHARFDWS